MKSLTLKYFLVSCSALLLCIAMPSLAENEGDNPSQGSDPVYYFNQGTNLYESGDFPQALFMFKVAALAGHAEAAIQVGLMYDFGLGTPRSFHEARRWYLKAALSNHPRGLYLLGHMEEFGEGRLKDYGKAFHWYQRAAEMGDTDAQYSVGEFYLSGKFVRKSNDKAVRWLSLAADQCHDQALVLLQDIGQSNPSGLAAVCY